MIRRAVLVLTLSTTFAYAADHHFERSLPAGSSPNVSVSTPSGYIHVRPGTDNEVHVSAHLNASHGGSWFGGSNDAEQRIEEIVRNPPIQQNGNEIVIGERQHRDLYRDISIDYDVTLPRNAVVDVRTGSGDIQTQDVGQSLKADTGSGTLNIHQVHGPVSLRSGSGDIDLEEAAPGDVRADTGSGSLHLRGVVGGLQAQSGSGDIEVWGRPDSDWRLQTGSGSLRLNLNQDARFNLTASTGSGDVHVHQPINLQTSGNGHHVSGQVNGGGPNLRLNTGSGDIEIR